MNRVALDRSFEERASGALKDLPLRQALDTATERFMAQRTSAFQNLPGAEELRQRARAIKEDVLTHLDDHLGQLADSVRKRGGIVHLGRLFPAGDPRRPGQRRP